MEFPDLESAIKKSFPFTNPGLIDSLVNYLKQRLGIYYTISKKIFIEKNYVDINWRDLFSHHYSKSYYEECTKFTIRVHLFRAEFDESDYLGYLILRPLPTNFALAKIVLRPIKESYSSDKFFLMTNEEEANINALKMNCKIDSFCVLVQDTVANVCADACINMTAKYLSKTFPTEFPNYKPANLFPFELNRRPIPSYGLTIFEISQILLSAGYRSYIEQFEKKDDLIHFIDSQIESALPVILAYDGHVSIIAGHTLEKDGTKKYILFDDSGYHLEKYGHFRKSLFTGTIDLTRINYKEAYAISFDFDKVFTRSKMVNLIVQNTTLPFPINVKRKMLVEYKALLKFLRKKDVEFFNLQNRNPHYVWWIESDSVGIILDAASHKYDVFYSALNFTDFSGPFSQLTEFQ